MINGHPILKQGYRTSCPFPLMPRISYLNDEPVCQFHHLFLVKSDLLTKIKARTLNESLMHPWLFKTLLSEGKVEVEVIKNQYQKVEI